MKKLLFLLLGLSALISCSKDDKNEDIQTDTNKILIKSIEHSDDGGITYSTFIYDSLGRLEKKIDPNNNPSYQNFYLNNDDSQIKKTEYYDLDGSISSIQNYEYDDKKRLIKRTYSKNNIITTESIYDRDDNENTVEIHVSDSPQLTKHYLDSLNKVLKTEHYELINDEYILFITITPTYDSNENILKIVNKSPQSTFTSNFTYDDKLNPFLIVNDDFTSNIDSKVDLIGINYDPYITSLPKNNFTTWETELTQINGENGSWLTSRVIEYNEADFPIKITSTKTSSTITLSNTITIFNYY